MLFVVFHTQCDQAWSAKTVLSFGAHSAVRDERPLVTDYECINITLNARPPQLRVRRLATVNRQLADNTAVNTGAHERQRFLGAF